MIPAIDTSLKNHYCDFDAVVLDNKSVNIPIIYLIEVSFQS